MRCTRNGKIKKNNLIVSGGADKKRDEIGLQLFRTPKAFVGWVHLHLNSDRRLLLIASVGATAK